MLYAAYHFDYPYNNRDYFNIGDYIQSLAAIRYLPRLDLTIDRDSIATFRSDNKDIVKLIGNSWYCLKEKSHMLHNNIDFLPVSVHVNNPSENIQKVLASWAKFGPIGCRDIQTKELINYLGYDAYFSSCLTTTLTREFVLDNSSLKSERKGILLVDIDECLPRLKYWPLAKFFYSRKQAHEYHRCLNELKLLLRKYDGEKIERLTHTFPKTLSHAERFEIAKNLLRKYANASLVITSRIHCALPCLALGTPVVLMTKKFDELRYRGIYDFFNHIGLNENLEFSIDLNYRNGLIVNKNTHIKKANELIDKCEKFIGNT